MVLLNHNDVQYHSTDVANKFISIHIICNQQTVQTTKHTITNSESDYRQVLMVTPQPNEII